MYLCKGKKEPYLKSNPVVCRSIFMLHEIYLASPELGNRKTCHLDVPQPGPLYHVAYAKKEEITREKSVYLDGKLLFKKDI